MKRSRMVIAVVLVLLLLLLTSCSKLNGKYVSEDEIYIVEFQRDGTCTWYQDGMFFLGEYEKNADGYILKITGNLLYPNSFINAVEDGDDLIITISNGDEVRFIKQK